jgi:Ca2+-binding EF-hand superfamily protein
MTVQHTVEGLGGAGELRDRLTEMFRYRGSDVRSAYKDFDKLNHGTVSVTQFRRAFPADVGTLLSEADMRLLIASYETGNGKVDYMALHRDVCEYGADLGFTARAPTHPPAAGEAGRAAADGDDDVIVRLRVAFYRTRVRPVDFFKDHDKLRSSVVTESQFVRGLSTACAAPKGLRLSPAEVQAVCDRYRAFDGGVRYRDFCNDVGGAFVVPVPGTNGGANLELEQNPTVEPPFVSRTVGRHPLPSLLFFSV